MGESSVGSWKRSVAEGIALGTGTEGLFSFWWPGPGNSEGPVDPDPFSIQPRGESFANGSGACVLGASPWPSPGNSEADEVEMPRRAMKLIHTKSPPNPMPLRGEDLDLRALAAGSDDRSWGAEDHGRTALAATGSDSVSIEEGSR
jgi:hypothetical protein